MNGFQKTSILKVCLTKWSESGRGLSEGVKIQDSEVWKTKTRFSSSEEGGRGGVWCVHQI